MPRFSNVSKQRLSTCHSDLQRIFNEVIKHTDCKVLCGMRTESEQELAFLNKHSDVQWPNSKHNSRPSMAADVVKYPIVWPDEKIEVKDYVKQWGRIYRFAGFVLGVASQMDIKLKWGGDFKNFIDSPHFQLEE